MLQSVFSHPDVFIKIISLRLSIKYLNLLLFRYYRIMSFDTRTAKQNRLVFLLMGS